MPSSRPKSVLHHPIILKITIWSTIGSSPQYPMWESLHLTDSVPVCIRLIFQNADWNCDAICERSLFQIPRLIFNDDSQGHVQPLNGLACFISDLWLWPDQQKKLIFTHILHLGPCHIRYFYAQYYNKMILP